MSGTMLAQSLVFLCLAAIAQSRVSFVFSEVLGTNDLLTTPQASFLCVSGCRVYSPTPNDQMIITDNAFLRVYYNLKQLSELKLGEYYELPPRPDPYWVINLERFPSSPPPFVFYVIEKGAPNYDTKVLYVTDAKSIEVRNEPLLTVMSSTGAIHFSDISGEFSDALPTVHATGFDSLFMCRPAYKAISAASVHTTSFPVYSPIATIDLGNSSREKSVRVSGDPNGVISTGTDTTSVFTSPGFVGCGTDAKYSLVPESVIGINSTFTVQDDKGLSIHIAGDYSISAENGEVTVSVNKLKQKLSGTNNSYAMDYEPVKRKSPVQIGVKWDQQDASQDTFALQIDVISKHGIRVETTTVPVAVVESTTQEWRSTKTKLRTEEITKTTSEKRFDITTTKSGRSLCITGSILMVAYFVRV